MASTSQAPTQVSPWGRARAAGSPRDPSLPTSVEAPGTRRHCPPVGGCQRQGSAKRVWGGLLSTYPHPLNFCLAVCLRGMQACQQGKEPPSHTPRSPPTGFCHVYRDAPSPRILQDQVADQFTFWFSFLQHEAPAFQGCLERNMLTLGRGHFGAVRGWRRASDPGPGQQRSWPQDLQQALPALRFRNEGTTRWT